MSEITIEDGWEQQRRTGRFEVESYPLSHIQQWLRACALPSIQSDELFVDYNARVRSERQNAESEEKSNEE